MINKQCLNSAIISSSIKDELTSGLVGVSCPAHTMVINREKSDGSAPNQLSPRESPFTVYHRALYMGSL